MTIAVHSRPRYPQCDVTYRILNRQGIGYHSTDVTEDIDALEYIKGLGYQQAPIVVAGDSHWSSSRPDRIKAAAAVHLDPVSFTAGQA